VQAYGGLIKSVKGRWEKAVKVLLCAWRTASKKVQQLKSTQCCWKISSLNIQEDNPNFTENQKKLVKPCLVMQHHLSVQGWCASASATLLPVENPPASHQPGSFCGMSDVAVYLCPFHHEHFIDCGNVFSQHIDNKHPYLNSGDS